MATITATTTETVTEQRYDEEQLKQFRLEEFVKEATWKEVLVELVDSNKLDPWNIDISAVVDGYIGTIKKMKVLDLHLPANIIFAAAVLLRLKSDTLKDFNIIEEPLNQEDMAAAGPRVYPEVPQLVPRMRLQPNKRITLIELMGALEDAMKMKEHREMLLDAEPEQVQLFINQEDIDQKIENIYSMVRENVDKEGMTTFAHLANKYMHHESILLDLFIPLLFLTHKQRLIMMQERFFDEIFIRLDDGDVHGGPATDNNDNNA